MDSQACALDGSGGQTSSSSRSAGPSIFERSEPSPGPPIASESPLPSDTPDLQELREALENLPFVASADDVDLVGPIDVAGRDEILLGRIDPSNDDGRSWWITAVMDNLTRGGGLNALELADPIL